MGQMAFSRSVKSLKELDRIETWKRQALFPQRLSLFSIINQGLKELTY